MMTYVRATRTLFRSMRGFASRALRDAFPTVPRVGLINAHATEDAFTTKLDFSTVDKLLTDRKQVQDAVHADAKQLGMSPEDYLEHVCNNVRDFV